LHYAPPPGVPKRYPISAIFRDTQSEPNGPAVPPGRYTVRLTAGGSKPQEWPLVVKMDPRVTTPPEGLDRQFKLSMQCYTGLIDVNATISQIRVVRKRLTEARTKAQALSAEFDAFDAKMAALEGARPARGRRRAEQSRELTLGQTAGELARLLEILQGADAEPTSQATTAVGEVKKQLDGLLLRWTEIRRKDLVELNNKLKAAGLVEIAF
jgi:hypothetical protein